MLFRLLKTYLRPYRGSLMVVIIFQLIGTIASLYLPRLNADIIDNGVEKGDTGYIFTSGGYMLGVTLLQIACSIIAVYFGHARPWDSGAMYEQGSSTGSANSPIGR